MKITDFPVPPIVRAVTVGFVPMQAFAVFVEDFARWWPLTRVHTGLDPVECAIEPWAGGRVFERAADGRETCGAPCWPMTRRIASLSPGSSNYRLGWNN